MYLGNTVDLKDVCAGGICHYMLSRLRCVLQGDEDKLWNLGGRRHCFYTSSFHSAHLDASFDRLRRLIQIPGKATQRPISVGEKFCTTRTSFKSGPSQGFDAQSCACYTTLIR